MQYNNHVKKLLILQCRATGSAFMIKTDLTVSTQHDTHGTDSQRGHAVLHEKALRKTTVMILTHTFIL